MSPAELLELLGDNATQSPHGDPVGFVISIAAAILFGIALKTLYYLYYLENEPQDGSLARSLVLLTPSLTASFWLTQHSLILSVGLMGSLSFVRFRTPVKRAEDVAFIVIMLAVALSCAVQAYSFGLALVTLILLFTLSRKYLGRFLTAEDSSALITFNTKKPVHENLIRQTLQPLPVNFVSARTFDGITSYVFKVSRFSKVRHEEVTEKLSSLDSQGHVNIFYSQNRLGS